MLCDFSVIKTLFYIEKCCCVKAIKIKLLGFRFQVSGVRFQRVKV